MRSISEGLLASMFEGFWSVFGPNLGGKIHQKSMSKCSKEMSKLEERLECIFLAILKASLGEPDSQRRIKPATSLSRLFLADSIILLKQLTST